MSGHAAQTAPLEEITAQELPDRCRAAVQKDAAGLDALTSQIGVFDTQSIVTFGAGAAAELGKSADAILKSIRRDQLSDPGPMLSALGSLMEKLDMNELAGTEKKGWRPFRSPAKGTDQLLEKYRAIGADIDRAYIALKKYEAEIRAYDGRLKAVYDANLRFYEDLVRYILAGEQGLREIQEHLAAGRIPAGDRDTVQRSYTLLERRVHDLRLSEVVALQSLPMVQTIRTNNLRLIEKINSAFLVTLPIFRQVLAQAVARKRQGLQAQALEALDKRAREALEAQGGLRSGQRAADGKEDAARLKELEQTREIILQGIQEARALRQAGEACRAEAKVL